MVFKQRKLKRVHDITCFKIPKRGGTTIRGGATIRGNTVFTIFCISMIKIYIQSVNSDLCQVKTHDLSQQVCPVKVKYCPLWKTFPETIFHIQ